MKMEEQNRDSTLCKVCGDKASGKHYGVPSCDGCRGFFKRSIRRHARNLDYVCKENGQCIVDVSRRNQCQACRFAKCLEVNMKRDAVQHERAPRSTSSLVSAVRRAPSAIYPAVSHVYHTTATPAYHPLLYSGLFPFKPTVTTFTPALPHFLHRPTPEPLATAAAAAAATAAAAVAKEDEVTSSEEANSIRPCEQQKDTVGCFRSSLRLAPLPGIATTLTEYSVSTQPLLPPENVYESAAKLLFLAVKWARSIPSFLELSFRDQAILLEESWSELFVLTAAQWNFTMEESLSVSLMLLPTERQQLIAEELRRLRELLAKFTIMRVDHSEYACLKAIALFKGESRGLCDSGRVSALQEQTVTVLGERGAGRVGRLLLLLPPARALCRGTLQELLFKPTVGDVSVERLLGDMVRATRPS
ncbi:nuclear receptor subfamily 2 group E member 1-like [Fopius arisanus]|uniref:Nuclear receptor subfamily 2 group E member 1-like n=1 Tax=Fopius arisanus TaxID=64838 RepID=A0A9R1TVH9_9HYME|nr:PREDICTED: nuclear receptor subfamily 2 group E member 1-like [Fopius arisanus]